MRLSALFVTLIICLFSQISLAYIPPTKMILQRVAENSGSGTYTIEQEVQLSVGLEPIYLKETWVVENERNMRLTVTGTKDLKDLVKLQFVYTGGQKWRLRDGRREASKIPEEFTERYFHIRSTENLIAYLQQLKILPSLSGRKSVPKKGEDFKYESEPFVRLGRSEGTISYAFGSPTPPDQKVLNPGLWVEQDQFLIRKIRFPTQAEVTAENFAPFARGLNFPKLRTIQWNQNTVYVRLLNVAGKSAAGPQAFQAASLEVPYTVKNLPNASAQTLIEEFYSRFR
jgi:hypothetical protein